jgi:Family of unknown function (DUF6529)
MEDFFVDLTRGNLAEVKVMLAAVVGVLAVYQTLLMVVGWGRVSVGFLSQAAASRAHLVLGGTIVFVTLFVSLACLSYFGWEDGGVHAVTGVILAVALALKVAVVRWLDPLRGYLPLIGTAVLALFAITVGTSAVEFLIDD